MIVDQEWAAVSIDLLQSAVPWRTFRWYKGQKHYSGTYWSATIQGSRDWLPEQREAAE